MMFSETETIPSDVMVEKIVAFVDREAGRDAPMTDHDEAVVRRLIEDDSSVHALVDCLRATNAELDTILDGVTAVKVPEYLVIMICSHAANNVAIADPIERPGSSRENNQRSPRHLT